MAHFVAKTLHIRPNDILDGWCVPELIVAYGEYANEIADKNYREYVSTYIEPNKKPERPPRYAVRFIGLQELQDG